VTDTGFGMTPDVLRNAFEPFYTSKGSSGGTGLGLATCYGIVKQSGGYIWVNSAPNEGTTFTMYWPCTSESLAVQDSASELAASSGGTETILVVEDEPSVREIIVTVLGAQGYAVLEAANGSKALDLLEQRDPSIDLLLTDIVMPQMNGRELACILTRERPELKVIYMSGYDAQGFSEGNPLVPGSKFLQKPVRASKLAKTVREALDT